MKLELKFDSVTVEAELNNSAVAARLTENLPTTIELTTWGDEAYGTIGVDLGEENPVPHILEGGIAYTNNGNYLCFFYGQTPAWPVEYIGDMDKNWKELITTPPSVVTVSLLK